MSYLDKSLVPSEVILYRTKPHWIIFTPCLGWLFLAILIVFLAPNYIPASIPITAHLDLTDLLGLIVLIIGLLSGIGAYINYQTSEYGITNRRIVMKTGFIRRITLEILLVRVEGIQVYQSIPGRILDYGSIIITGTGGSKDPFPNIPEPFTFRKQAQQQLEHFT